MVLKDISILKSLFNFYFFFIYLNAPAPNIMFNIIINMLRFCRNFRLYDT